MDIIHLGHSSFKIKGKKATIITDPFNPQMVGIKFPKNEANVVTVSHNHEDHNFVEGVSGDAIVVQGPGEYEIKGVKIIGIPSFHDDKNGQERGKNTIYHIEADDITIAHLGDLGHKLGDSAIEFLNGVDVLMIPVGGIYTINPATAAAIITSLEPSIIIPMHYLQKGMNTDTFGKLDEVSSFLKELGKDSTVPIPKLSISKDKIGAESTVVVLEQ